MGCATPDSTSAEHALTDDDFTGVSMSQNEREPQRRNKGWLAQPERLLLAWLADRLPAWFTPNRLTSIGGLGAVLTFIGYILAPRLPAALALVNLGLLVNWFGDSLDGHIARRNGQSRPNYGFFLDQSVDVLSQLLFAAGLAFSGYLRPEIVAFGFATYLMMTVQSLLRVQVRDVFDLSTGGFGLTEVRAIFFVANIAFFIAPPEVVKVGPLEGSYADLGGIVWIIVNVAMYIVKMIGELKWLSEGDKIGAHFRQRKAGR
jgi:phosphatidylglycerophosphate synthase